MPDFQRRWCLHQPLLQRPSTALALLPALVVLALALAPVRAGGARAQEDEARSPSAALGLRMWTASSAGSSGNRVIAPAALTLALRALGETMVIDPGSELARLLSEGGDRSLRAARHRRGGSTLVLAAAVFIDPALQIPAPRLERLRRRHAVQAVRVPLRRASAAGRARISRWIAARGLDPGDLARSEQPHDLLVVSTMTFAAHWSEPFMAYATEERPFTLESGEVVSVPTMWSKRDTPFSRESDADIVEVALRGGYFATFVLPRAVDGLPAFESGLTTARLEGWMRGSTLRTDEVQVSIPMAAFATTADLGSALAELGVDARGLRAPDGREAELGAALHATEFAMDEHGIRARSLTQIDIVIRSDPVHIVFDHPFIVFVHDRSRLLLMSRIADPRSTR